MTRGRPVKLRVASWPWVISEINGSSWKFAAQLGDTLGPDLLLFGEDQQQAFIAQQVVEDAAKKGGFAGSGADRRDIEARKIHESLQSFAIGCEEPEGINCKDFSFFRVVL